MADTIIIGRIVHIVGEDEVTIGITIEETEEHQVKASLEAHRRMTDIKGTARFSPKSALSATNQAAGQRSIAWKSDDEHGADTSSTHWLLGKSLLDRVSRASSVKSKAWKDGMITRPIRTRLETNLRPIRRMKRTISSLQTSD